MRNREGKRGTGKERRTDEKKARGILTGQVVRTVRWCTLAREEGTINKGVPTIAHEKSATVGRLSAIRE